jgi:hypothetical protein
VKHREVPGCAPYVETAIKPLFAAFDGFEIGSARDGARGKRELEDKLFRARPFLGRQRSAANRLRKPPAR